MKALASTLAAIPLLACQPALAGPMTRTVVIEGMKFAPATFTVRSGDVIVWENRDFVPHTATAPGAFDSGLIPAGGSWRFVARTGGRFDYVCTLHPTMKATLVVERGDDGKRR